MNYSIYCIAFCFILSVQSYAQENLKSLNDEQIYQLAKDKSKEKNYAEAEEMLTYLLTRTPRFHDARILHARILAWQKQFTASRQQLNIVLSDNSTYEDALHAFSDVELWDEQYQSLLDKCEEALKFYVNDLDFLFKKAVALDALDRTEEAVKILEEILQRNTEYKQAKALLDEINNRKLKYVAGASYGIDLFNRAIDPSHRASIFISRTQKNGTAIFRSNYASRFNLNGAQLETDLYPKISKRLYAFLNYGYSSSRLFPNHRAGAELFAQLPMKLEASAGMRYLVFDSGSKVEIYTGSLGIYAGKYWMSFRPFIIPNAKGTSFASLLIVRRYTGDRNEYIGLNAGYGFTPDERRLQTTTGMTTESIYNLKSFHIGLDYAHNLPRHYILLCNIISTRQQFIFDAGNYITITGFNVGLSKKF